MGEIEVCAQWRSGSRQILRCQNCLQQNKRGGGGDEGGGGHPII